MRNSIRLSAFLLTALVFSSCSTVAFQDKQKEADYHYKMGIASLSEGNLQSAYVELQKTLQLNPRNKDALVSLGYVHLQYEEYEKAKELFLRAVSIDPQYSDAYTYLGITYIKSGQREKAVEAFRRALSNVLYRTPEKAFYYLGIAYYRLGRFDNAIDAFKDSIKRSPSSPQAYYGLSLAYNKTGRYADAAAVIEQAIEADKSFNGDKSEFVSKMKQTLATATGEDETDAKDYLEIMKY